MVMERLDNYSSRPVDHCSGGKTGSIGVEAAADTKCFIEMCWRALKVVGWLCDGDDNLLPEATNQQIREEMES